MGDMGLQGGRHGQYDTVSNSPGAVPPRKHKLHRSNIEQEANDANAEHKAKGKQDFPWTLHKQAGLSKEVHNQQQYDDAMAKGWYDDVRNVPSIEPVEAPTRINHMTTDQAFAFIRAHANDPVKLMEIEHDERTAGNRAKVLAAIEEAKDNIGAPMAKPTGGILGALKGKKK